MNRILSLSLFVALLISLCFNLCVLSENKELKRIPTQFATKQDAAGWYHRYRMHVNSGNPVAAELCLTLSAQLGNADAQFILAEALLEKGEEKNAEVWMTEAAGQGNPEYQYQLGRCCDYVFSRESDREKDRFKALAFVWYRQAAEQQHAAAAKFLAQCYRLGSGCKVDMAAAEYWYKKAAELGEYVNRGLAEVYIATERAELAVPLLSAEAADGSAQAQRILRELDVNKSDSQ